jgi:hypothetical protein
LLNFDQVGENWSKQQIVISESEKKKMYQTSSSQECSIFVVADVCNTGLCPFLVAFLPFLWSQYYTFLEIGLATFDGHITEATRNLVIWAMPY